ncbi:hypothetical protein ARALYDRAFT_350338 [Arabidopsis lyrata subsp. lyrata]|uniref:TFIIS central domain-containing protein n=1 Tax=Arabidopsis lyrata subsp. lyrata TaxID=81972 RepID=D7M3Q6_ARALL|nr:hypothetical protein ARALYDRAFT_350338 [Arabidopsis lyrata subsp. lyrata]
MAEFNGSMQLAGKRKSPPETTLGGSASEVPNKHYRPWLQQLSPASNGILHIPTNMLSQKTLHSLMHGKKVTQTESPLQKSVKPVVSKKQQIPPQRSVKAMDEVNESVRSKMRESLASALALVQKDDESPKGKENIGTVETPVITQENTQSFQPVSPASITVPIGEGIMSEMPTGVESSVQKDNLGETKDYGTGGEKSYQDPKLLASKIEMELYKLFGGVNKKYRERGRSLLFNLKDKNNPDLRERVMSEEISAERLCSMTAEELASKELSQWRQAKAEEMAKMVVLQDTDIDVRSLVRKTHKGEFQVEIEPVDRGTVDVSGGIMSRSKRRPKARSHSVKTTLKDEAAKADSEKSRSTPPSTEEIDPMQGLGIDDEFKDVGFLPPIVSLDEFMESLDSEPPFESPHGNSEMQVSLSEKSDSEAGSDSKSPKGSPKEPSDKSLPEPKPEKIDEVSPKVDANVKVDDDVARLEKTSALSDDKGERAWDGILQLNMSSVVPVTGIFKSGEKAETSEWPAMVEVKGRVRLSGFGKFIQELPKSRTRALMVMYLACKDGISESQRGSLIEVIDSYVADQRVGYAEPASGVELYLCPTRGETLDLLSKVISQEQLDELKSLDIGLVGVVVWRRAVVPKPSSGSRRQHSSSSFLGSKTSVLPVNKKQRMHVSEKPLVVASIRNRNHGYGGEGVKHVAAGDDDDDVPPGFGPVASRDDDDLPEFNFSSSVVPVTSPQPLPAQSKSLDQVRKLIHKYGKSASIYDDDDDEDDIPEWQPHVPSHQLPPPPPPPPGFRPEVFRPPQDGWWDNQNGGSGQHYERNQSRNRGF